MNISEWCNEFSIEELQSMIKSNKISKEQKSMIKGEIIKRVLENTIPAIIQTVILTNLQSTINEIIKVRK